jgi:hypothetical protein
VRIPFGKSRTFGRIEPRVHAGENGEPAGRRKAQFSLIAKAGGVLAIGLENFIADLAHWGSPLHKGSVLASVSREK